MNASVRLDFVLLEHFLQSDMDKDDAEDDAGTMKILLRKKRAILSAKKLIDPTIFTCSSLLSLTNNDLPQKRSIFFTSDAIASGRSATSPYSGLSPPVVSPFI